MKAYMDNLGSSDMLDRYSSGELAQALGGYREMWADLGSVVKDLDAVGMVGDGSGHPYGPMVLHKLGSVLRHHHDHGQHHSAVTRMLHHLYSVMAHNEHLKRQHRLWHGASNVISSVQWVNLAANTSSSTATLQSPYSGVNYMILDILCDSIVMPPGWFVNLSFAGINFAQPATNRVTYGTPGASGTPATPGMGWSAFLQDKTFPDGRRYWNPWVGWILSSDAVSTWQIYNADQAFPRTFCFDVLMRSSPCQDDYNTNKRFAWHDSELGNHALDLMFAAVHGLGGQPKGDPTTWGTHQGVGVPGIFPSGHSPAAILPHGGPPPPR